MAPLSSEWSPRLGHPKGHELKDYDDMDRFGYHLRGIETALAGHVCMTNVVPVQAMFRTVAGQI
jgi:hypothetical protein